MFGRYKILDQIEKLDPEKDAQRIVFLSGSYEFPKDIEISLAIAFFRTFAIPSIAKILDKTKQFENFGQKRYDDTTLILGEFLENGLDSERGKQSIRRLNQIHDKYPIKNEDYVYTLSTFVFEPGRWNEKYGWRRATRKELLANYYFWKKVGGLMGIKKIPSSYESLEDFNREFERKNFKRTPESEKLGKATLEILAGRLPKIPGIKRIVFQVLFSLMEDDLRDAMGFPKPNPLLKKLTVFALFARAWILRTIWPPRRKPFLVTKRKNPTYPDGYLIESLGPN
ncbi:hypothetical protein CH373_12755 [Leptospira perolatii]|uniref:ER-bound oxygenase mpaB/mpaB'/Rubber oxygenase catalytic domain-containing protein n=1 Tax=Leptospira perolatii TaxID=2023191 RepID=A0A2M9ZLJ7_9LEPT|nr:oxygenase MpaB family protein [Leptospira perolatii]PJZ70198.1 hypothetical protein CH360_06215 [Leptospira perolatii]PJZ72917.1 hypothetical protein CH373_12755 [Leptospira perolatii]